MSAMTRGDGVMKKDYELILCLCEPNTKNVKNQIRFN